MISKFKFIFSLIFILTISIEGYSQTFTHSGTIRTEGNVGVTGVSVKLYKRTTPTITGFTQQTNYNGHSYYRSTGSMTWTNAKVACENMGGHLATISNSAENTFLFNTWPSGWIGYYQDRVAGYTYSEPGGGYRWTENQVTNGLSADYDVSSFTAGTTTLNDIVSSINATLYNSPTYSNTGGKYLTFNGVNQYAITNDLSSKFIDSKISIVAWIYPMGNGVILSELNVPTTSSGWHESVIEITGNNTLRIGLWNGLTITQLSTPITLNTWNMVCLTYDGTTMRGFLNNVNFGSVNFNRSAAFIDGGNGQQHFAFGLTDATNMGSGAYGKFRLGDIQFFNRDITSDEIDRTFNLYAYRYRTNQYIFWNSGEPNNSGGTEDYAQFVGGGRWNDLPNTSLPYVLEFDYIVTTTPWVLEATSTTNSSGQYSFSLPTNPSIEWYIEVVTPTVSSNLSSFDFDGPADVVLGKVSLKPYHYHKSDLNADGKITVGDVCIVADRINGIPFTKSTLLFTNTQWTSLNSGTSDLRTTIPGITTSYTFTPTSGGTSNFYLLSPGYNNQGLLTY